MPIDQELLEKFYRNQCTPEEHQQVLQWLQNPDHEAAVQHQMLERWEGLKRERIRHEPDGQQLFEQVQATLDARSRVRPLYQRMLQAAAVLALLMVTSALAWLYLGPARYRVEMTAAGKTRRITLPDGSSVHLNSHSKITYAAEWPADRPREVWLEGEAYFSVRHTRSHQPFRVHTKKQFNVEVLGTEFNVYSRDNGAKVVLNRGQVRLHLEARPAHKAAAVLMKPGELVSLEATRYEKKQVNPALYSSWTERKLLLNNTPLAEVLTVLRETHEIDLRVQDAALLQHRASGTIPTADQAVLLSMMAEVFEMEIAPQSGYFICNALP